MQTLYYFTALQPFVFGMRYLQSATRCALSKPCATLNCIKYTTVIVAIFYSGVLIGTMLVICRTLPTFGSVLEDFGNFIDWFNNVCNPCNLV
jgi:hypothetical protein